MRNTLFILIAVTAMVGMNVPAQAEVKSLTVQVDGLACPFCAYGLEKKLKKVEGVEALNIDINTGEVVLSVAAGTRLIAVSGAKEQASVGLIAQVQKAVEDGGFTPRAFAVTLAGTVTSQSGEMRIELSGTGESLLLEESDGQGELQKVAGRRPVQIVGILHPEEAPLRLTLKSSIAADSVAVVIEE